MELHSKHIAVLRSPSDDSGCGIILYERNDSQSPFGSQKIETHIPATGEHAGKMTIGRSVRQSGKRLLINRIHIFQFLYAAIRRCKLGRSFECCDDSGGILVRHSYDIRKILLTETDSQEPLVQKFRSVFISDLLYELCQI